MHLSDRIYGEFDITSPVLVELIESKPMQRLKKISQAGVPNKYYFWDSYYRFEHCVGVMLLLRRLGASEEEQIAGLLHDVSHTAFSHVVDYVVGSGLAEDFQDTSHEQYILSTDIPQILAKHGYDVARIIDYHNFGLLERNAPDLCADRVDYSLRQFAEPVAQQILLGLCVNDGKIVGVDQIISSLFAREYLKAAAELWSGFETDNRYTLFARALKRAIELKAITMDDFWTDDEAVLAKVEAIDDTEIKHILSTLTAKSLAGFPVTDEVVHKKFRFVDPEFVDGDHLTRLSTVDATYAAELEAAREDSKKGTRLVDIGL